MADTVLDYNIRLIENGANNNTWGEKNNDNWQIAVNLFDGTTGFTPNLLTGWKVGGVAVSSTAAELNKLAGITGNFLTDAQADTLTKGFNNTPYNAGTKSSGTFTPDPTENNLQYCVNGGAFTLAAPATDCSVVVQMTNNASAGAVTVSGYTRQVGDELTTTNGHDFMLYITRVNGFSVLNVVALQ